MDESFDALMARFKGEPISRHEIVDVPFFTEAGKEALAEGTWVAQPVDNSKRIQLLASSVLSLVNASETVNTTLAAKWLVLAEKIAGLIEVLVNEEQER